MKKRPEMDDEIFDEILENIRDGMALRKMCKDSRRRWPTAKAFYRYLRVDEQREKDYARAKQDGIEAMVDEIPHIADTEPDPQKARIRIDARKWVAGKLKPKKYNDKYLHEHSGPDGGPMKVQNIYEGMTEEDMNKIDEED